MFALVALAGCHRASHLALGVEPLQLFGAEPELMPALQFEPSEGTLLVTARRPVFVTVVEVDPRTQDRTVVFPESGRAPLRVSGEIAFQLPLRRGGDATSPSGRIAGHANRGSCATEGAAAASATARCPTAAVAAGRGDARAPMRGVLVIASTDSLVVAGEPGEGLPRAWTIPDEMPEAWAAVYVWPPRKRRGE